MNTIDVLNAKIEEILSNPTNWQKPWFARKSLLSLNVFNNSVYSGMYNQIILDFEIFTKGYKNYAWLTFQQIDKKGGKVKKGEKGCPIFFTSYTYWDALGNKADEKKYKENPKDYKAVPFLKHWFVFNVEQTENLPDEYFKYTIENEPIFNQTQRREDVDQFIDSFGIDISFEQPDRCFYRRSNDSIHMVRFENFKSSNEFYATLFHEIGHWSGEPERLNRKKGQTKGDKDYAFEELVAELTSAYLCSNFEINSTIENSAAYIASWLKHLKNDKQFFFKASGLALKAANYILALKEQKINVA